MDIKYEVSQLNDVSNRMGSISQTIQEVKSTLRSLSDHSQADWYGKAAEHFQQESQRIDGEVERYLSALQASRSALTAALAAYETQETAQVQKLGDLPITNVF